VVGQVYGAEDWEDVLLPEIERQQEPGEEVAFRGDAAFSITRSNSSGHNAGPGCDQCTGIGTLRGKVGK
jgi:hypothetical protein